MCPFYCGAVNNRIEGMSPVKNTPMPDILGPALKAAREARRYERSELAGLCCLSAKMILELEEGGMSSFYSYPLKINAAKRVGTLLNLSESDYLNYPRAAMVNSEGVEEGSLEGEIKNEANESAPTIKASPSARDGISTDAVDSAITERLEWQELLTEKVGGDLAVANTRSGSRFPVKSIVVLSVGIVIAGIVFGLNSKYDIAYQVASLLEPEAKPQPQEILPAEPPKTDSDEAKAEVKNAPAEASQEIKPPEVVAAAGQCPLKQDGQLLSYQTPAPTKAGDTVNIKTLIKQTICFIDGGGKQFVIALEANTAHAFKGVSPFTVLAQDLDNVEMFFQGWRVRLPNAGSKQVKLVEVN
jgi:transcriptional regulator with XRE-family HTH domain